MGARRNAAVYAGLVGAMALCAPTPAEALSLSDALGFVDGLFESPSTAFLVGLAGGVAVTGLVAAVATSVSRHRSRGSQEVAPIERGATRAEAPTGSRGPALAPLPARPATRDAIPAAVPSEPAPESGHRPRHMRPEATLFEDDSPEVAPAPSHVASDYEDIAENYVGRATFRERMARRAEGVAATLWERLGTNMMDGVPVIERADGSVGDVGTAWWKRAVGEQTIISDSGFAPDEPDLAIPSDFSLAGPSLDVAAPRAATAAPATASAPRGAGIALRVANIDEGAYPERRTVEDLGAVDEWDLALRSLDEKIAIETVAAAQEPVAFADMVGGADTLDEPDNLEPQTSFIPFKTPAGHPEVVDTETYVDYLIEDEFAKSSSAVARRSSSRFLRVLEGGTQPSSRHLSDTSTVRTSRAGKHFAPAMAAEA